MIGFALAWNIVLAGLHFWRIRSRRFIKWLLLAPIILLTTGPLYWARWMAGPPSPDEIAATRKPEDGDLEEVCRIEGLYYVAATSSAATNRGEIWIGRRAQSGDPIELYKLRSETACSLELIEALPKRARLLDGHLGRRAVYFLDDGMYGLSDDIEKPVRLATSPWDPRVVISDDGRWLASTFDPEPDKDDSSYELVIQKLDGSERQSATLYLDPEKPYPRALLAFDPSADEVLLESASSHLLRVGAEGHVISTTKAPSGCRDTRIGSWWIHPQGWAYSALGNCDLVWDLGGGEHRLDLNAYTVESLARWTRVDHVAISPDGSRLAFSTRLFLGEGTDSAASVVVIDADSETELARIHLRTGMSGTYEVTVSFLGPDHLLISQYNLIRLIRLHPQPGRW